MPVQRTFNVELKKNEKIKKERGAYLPTTIKAVVYGSSLLSPLSSCSSPSLLISSYA